MHDAFRTFLRQIGEDPARAGLKGTPERFTETLLELTSGYSQDLDTLVRGALYPKESDDLILMKDIEFYTLCEHHLLPFFGKVHVGYLPSKTLIGFSKIPRIIEMYARRLQNQEHLTKQIGEALESVLKPRGVAVVIEAEHLCMRMRGIKKQGARITTHYMRGILKDDRHFRQEFLEQLGVRLRQPGEAPSRPWKGVRGRTPAASV